MKMVSGIIELIGVKVLADIEPKSYTERIGHFHEILDGMFDGSVYADKFAIEGDREYFLIKSKAPVILLKFLRDLRLKLIKRLKDPILCRGVLMLGEYKLLDPENERVKGFGFRNVNDFTAMLYGELENFKGVGIKVDDAVVHSVSHNTAEKYLFKNYYVEDYTNTIFSEFNDLRFDYNIDSPEIRKVCISFEKANNLSPKLARYFISLFNNIVLHWKYKSHDVIKKKKIEGMTFDSRSRAKNQLKGIHPFDVEQLIYSGYFNHFKKVKGIRTVYLFYLCSLFQNRLINDGSTRKNLEQIIPRDMDYLVDKLGRNAWFMNFLKENAVLSVPSSLLNKSIKRKLLNAIEHLK